MELELQKLQTEEANLQAVGSAIEGEAASLHGAQAAAMDARAAFDAKKDDLAKVQVMCKSYIFMIAHIAYLLQSKCIIYYSFCRRRGKWVC